MFVVLDCFYIVTMLFLSCIHIVWPSLSYAVLGAAFLGWLTDMGNAVHGEFNVAGISCVDAPPLAATTELPVAVSELTTILHLCGEDAQGELDVLGAVIAARMHLVSLCQRGLHLEYRVSLSRSP